MRKIVVALGLVAGFSILGEISSQPKGEPLSILSDPSEVSQSPTSSDNKPNVETVFILSERPGQNRIVVDPFNPEGTQQSCNEKWTKRGVQNYEMINFCVHQQQEGYQKLKHTVSKIGGYSWGEDLYRQELNEWTKRGVIDYSELNYVIDHEYDSFLNLVYDFTHGSLNREAFNQSLDEWSNRYIQWSQVEYSYKRLTGAD